jgi:hypothetical protein
MGRPQYLVRLLVLFTSLFSGAEYSVHAQASAPPLGLAEDGMRVRP